MRRIFLYLLAGVSTLVLAAWASPRAVADDDGNQAEIKITAPLDAVDCTNNTVSVLGLTIDIHAARLSGGECDDDDDQGDDDQGDDVQGALNDDEGDDDQGECVLTCADLVAGQSVQVRLTSDAVPLTATEVRQSNEDDEGDDLSDDDSDSAVEVVAPIQDVDAAAQTIQVLGLPVFVGGAEFDGDCDDDEDGDDDVAADHNCEPVDLGDLLVGQFVKVELASSLPPFSATEVELQHSDSDVDVEVEGPDGDEIDDTDSQGTPLNDLTVHVKTKVKIAKRTAVAGARVRTVTRTLHIRGAVAGSRFTLSGLPSGTAKIEITRTTTAGLSSGRTKVVVLKGVSVPALVRLKESRRD